LSAIIWRKIATGQKWAKKYTVDRELPQERNSNTSRGTVDTRSSQFLKSFSDNFPTLAGSKCQKGKHR
jgi:hypothetical protein